MAIIYKYPIPVAAKPFKLEIRGFCEVVRVGLDGNQAPCVWILANPNANEEPWEFLVVGTDHEFNAGKWAHLGSWVGGGFVWHLMRSTDDMAREIQDPVATADDIVTLVYVISLKRKAGLPGLEKANGRFYYTFDDAKEVFDMLPDDLKLACGIFSVHAIIQQETAHEVPF